jgi:ureidoglycolate lyase
MKQAKETSQAMHTVLNQNASPLQGNGGVLKPSPLTPQAFAPFGQVLGLAGQPAALEGRMINGGNAQRYDLLPDLQMQALGGRPMLALFRAQARSFPLPLGELERHAHGAQAFIPLGTQRFMVVVAVAGEAPRADQLHAFVSDGRQGVVLAPGTWHHALLAIDGGDYVVIERRASAVDCDVHALGEPVLLLAG